MTTVDARPTPSPVARLLGRGATYSVATAIQGGVAVLTLPAITRSISSPAEYGVIAAGLVVIQFMATFASLGLPAALTREYYDTANTATAASRLIGSATLAAITITLAVHLSGPWWSNIFEQVDYSIALSLAVAAIAPTAVLAAGQALLRCQDKPRQFVAATVTGTAGAQILGLVMLWTGDPTPSRFFTGYVIGVAAGAAIAVGSVGVGNLVPANRSLTTQALKLGTPTLPHVMALYLVMAADRVIVERHRGLAEAGTYQFTYLLGMVGVSLLVAVNNAWVPVIYEELDARARWEALAATTSALFRLAVPVVAALSFAAPILLAIAAPADYDAQALTPVLCVAALSLIPYVAYLGAAMVVFYERKSLFFAVVTPSVAVFNLIANQVSVPRWGSVGAASVSLASYALLALLAGVAASRLVAVPWPIASIWRAAAAATAATTVSLVIPSGGAWTVVRVAVVMACGASAIMIARRVRRPMQTKPTAAPTGRETASR